VFKFILLSALLGISAQSSANSCVTDLMFNFKATATEAQHICSINSSKVFLKCMDHKSLTTQLDVHSAAVKCDSKFKKAVTPSGAQYVNFNTCEARLQAGARMSPRRSFEICQWDSSDVMMSCLMNIVQKAGWHSEHAIQYCDFANQNYRSQIPKFVQCVSTHPMRSQSVVETAQSCHDSILDIIIPRTQPRVRELPPVYDAKPTVIIRQQPEVVTSQSEVVTSQPEVIVNQPEVVVKDQPVEKVQPVVVETKPETKKVVTEKVPTPIKINVQESAKPEEIVDQPTKKDSSTNSEILPLD